MAQVSGTVSERIIQEVMTATSDTVAVPPLYDAIDPDALEAVIETMSDGDISFSYAGHEVTITSDGAISLDTHPARSPTGDTAVSDD